MIWELIWECSISYMISDSVVFPTSFLNYSDSVVFFYMISELLWQCGIFLHVFFTWFRNCSDSVVFFDMISELLWKCCIEKHVEKYHTVRTVPISCRNTCRKIQHFQSSSKIMSKNTTLSEQFRNNVKKHVEKYLTVLYFST
jgi:hypothetical protein